VKPKIRTRLVVWILRDGTSVGSPERLGLAADYSGE
jgi:hypothetical protein